MVGYSAYRSLDTAQRALGEESQQGQDIPQRCVLDGRVRTRHLLHLGGETAQQEEEVLVGLITDDQLDRRLYGAGGNVAGGDVLVQLPPVGAQHELDLVRIQVEALPVGEGRVQQPDGMWVAVVQLEGIRYRD